MDREGLARGFDPDPPRLGGLGAMLPAIMPRCRPAVLTPRRAAARAPVSAPASPSSTSRALLVSLTATSRALLASLAATPRALLIPLAAPPRALLIPLAAALRAQFVPVTGASRALFIPLPAASRTAGGIGGTVPAIRIRVMRVIRPSRPMGPRPVATISISFSQGLCRFRCGGR